MKKDNINPTMKKQQLNLIKRQACFQLKFWKYNIKKKKTNPKF